MIQQLRLVKDAPTHAISPPTDAIGRLFAHWLFMFGKSPRMCKLTTARRRLAGAWLTVYDEGILSLALDGAAADEFIAERGGSFTSIEWILRDEANIERYAEAGERLHTQVERARAAELSAQAAESQPNDPAQAAVKREYVRRWAARHTGRAV